MPAASPGQPSTAQRSGCKSCCVGAPRWYATRQHRRACRTSAGAAASRAAAAEDGRGGAGQADRPGGRRRPRWRSGVAAHHPVPGWVAQRSRAAGVVHSAAFGRADTVVAFTGLRPALDGLGQRRAGVACPARGELRRLPFNAAMSGSAHQLARAVRARKSRQGLCPVQWSWIVRSHASRARRLQRLFKNRSDF